jgi:hypothetical protein
VGKTGVWGRAGPQAPRNIRLSIETLADVPFFTARPSRAVASKRKVVCWILTGIVELLMVSLLTLSQLPQEVLHPHGTTLETTINLNGNDRTVMPASAPIVRPNAPAAAPPLIIPPPTPTPQFQIERPREDAGTPEGTLLEAIGRDIACAATNFEYLNAAQRARCERVPWQAGRLPDGTIVLAPQRPNRFAPPPPEYRISGADANRRAVEQAPVCDPMLNVPCMNIVPGRN